MLGASLEIDGLAAGRYDVDAYLCDNDTIRAFSATNWPWGLMRLRYGWWGNRSAPASLMPTASR